MTRSRDVESLSLPEVRACLPLWQLVRLYLDPFSLFKNVTIGSRTAQAEALHYNRAHRGLLRAYAGRWLVIGSLCLAGMWPLAALARAEPVLILPILGLEIGFAAAVCALMLSLAVYVLLGLKQS